MKMRQFEDKFKVSPLLVVLTPVRNEAWILHAFLKATSLWADYIIIADQMSTDGSREIYSQYEKVIVVDNPREEMHQARTRQLLFDAAKKIEGDKILFALDADEFLSGDFINTKSWHMILNSKPGDTFCFRWMNLLENTTQYYSSKMFYWAAHMNDDMLNGLFPDNHIHEWRLPWPNRVNNEYKIEDIAFIHFAKVNQKRNMIKSIFYRVATAYNDKNYSGIRLYRQYNQEIPITEIYDTPSDIYDFYINRGININKYINKNDIAPHFLENIFRMFHDKGLKYYAKLDIWDNDFHVNYQITNPQSIIDKVIFTYLRYTQKRTRNLLIRGIDYILKKIY